MKLLSFLLAIAILVLSFIPCSDVESMVKDQRYSPTVSKTSSQKSTGTEHDHQDLCSPFCQCSCCAVAYTIPALPVTNIEVYSTHPEQVFAAYLQ